MNTEDFLKRRRMAHDKDIKARQLYEAEQKLLHNRYIQEKRQLEQQQEKSFKPCVDQVYMNIIEIIADSSKDNDSIWLNQAFKKNRYWYSTPNPCTLHDKWSSDRAKVIEGVEKKYKSDALKSQFEASFTYEKSDVIVQGDYIGMGCYEDEVLAGQGPLEHVCRWKINKNNNNNNI